MTRLALALVLAGSGCGVLLPASAPPTTAPLFAVMDRFGCLGAWPAYELKVHANGVVEYHGLGYVRVVGKRTTDIGPAGVELLRRHLDRSGFFTEDHNYTSGAYDVCGIAWIEYHGKRVFFGGLDHQDVPDGLWSLVVDFERLSNSERWTSWPEGEDHVSTR